MCNIWGIKKSVFFDETVMVLDAGIQLRRHGIGSGKIKARNTMRSKELRVSGYCNSVLLQRKPKRMLEFLRQGCLPI